MAETETTTGTGRCIDCGVEAGGLRCRTCHGRVMRLQGLRETAEADRALLAMVAAENLTTRRLALRMGISATRAYDKVARARRREAQRAALGGALFA